jgi:cyclopropane-fatty-acyl-phospholipid synthase
MSKAIDSQRESAFNALFHDYEGPAVAVRFWDGWHWSSRQDEKPLCTVVINSAEAFYSLISEPNEITLGEAFIHGGLDVEGDLFSVFSLAEYVFNRPRSWRQNVVESAAALRFSWGKRLKEGARHSMRRDRASISYHYDQPAEFYAPWLGRTLAYSCAYFHSAQDTLDHAQEAKLDLICRKLRLQPGERFLDIGCGWGSLVLHAAAKYGVKAHGITLSKEQEQVAKRRIEEAGLTHTCVVELRDYREMKDLESAYDKIASVGMFEHVGLKNLPLYFAAAKRLLRPGGVFLNHGITRASTAVSRKSSFIDRYVFPDGHLVTLSQVVDAADAQDLEVRDVENLREHYEMTLRRWVEGLRKNSAALHEHVSEVTYRIWLLYMAGSAATFRRGDIAVHQILLSRPEHGASRLPLTREDWYAAKLSRPAHRYDAYTRKAVELNQST